MSPYFPIRIGLVEDHEGDVRLLRELLGLDHRIMAVFTTLEAALTALQEGQRFDLLLLDMMLPDSKGIENFRQVVAVAPELPVVILSGLNDEELALSIVQEGAQDYLLKGELSKTLIARTFRYAVERKRSEMALQGAHDEMELTVQKRTRELEDANARLRETVEELDQIRMSLIRQERLHALERMASGIAHDFNNALSPILAHSEWLLMKPHALNEGDRVAKTLLKIRDCAEQCAQTVKRLREFSRGRDPVFRFEQIDLSRVVLEAIAMTKPAWKNQARARGASLRMVRDLPAGIKVRGVRKELRELFVNLILNSIDAIPGEGMIEARVWMEAGEACASISDTGVGMDEQTGSRCLEPFFTTKNEEGSGMGLGVVYGIAQRHEAEIKLESTPGVGTSVRVRFPTTEVQEVLVEPVTPVCGLKILVAEDEAMIREVIGIYLSEDGHEAVMAADGSEALGLLESQEFDLVITDRLMPCVSGDRLVEWVRQRDGNQRIVLLTGFTSGDQDCNLPVDAIISKPFTLESLRMGIAHAMQEMEMAGSQG